MEFHDGTFYGYLIKGDLNQAITYIMQFPQQSGRYQKYRSVFEEACYFTLSEDSYLNKLLIIYQQYYRDVFYLNIPPESAAQTMRDRFLSLWNITGCGISLDDLEGHEIANAFTDRGFHFLGGRTSGYYGPYIWKTTQSKTYDVVLPNGTQQYTVRFLDGFLSKSWLDYISFGEVGTGGWTDADGIINCVKSAYDLQGERFTVSLLKHEAQHAMDLRAYPRISSEDLEYRAKLVELIYSSKRDLLAQLLNEADGTQASNGHCLASSRIAAEFESKQDRSRLALSSLSIEEIQAIARNLFLESNQEMDAKYNLTP